MACWPESVSALGKVFPSQHPHQALPSPGIWCPLLGMAGTCTHTAFIQTQVKLSFFKSTLNLAVNPCNFILRRRKQKCSELRADFGYIASLRSILSQETYFTPGRVWNQSGLQPELKSSLHSIAQSWLRQNKVLSGAQYRWLYPVYICLYEIH